MMNSYLPYINGIGLNRLCACIVLSKEIFSLTMKRVLWKHERNECGTCIRIPATIVSLRSSRRYKRKHCLLLACYFDPSSSFFRAAFDILSSTISILRFSFCFDINRASIWNTVRTFADETSMISIYFVILWSQIWIRFYRYSMFSTKALLHIIKI